jgi:mannose-6-phosphate isomerase
VRLAPGEAVFMPAGNLHAYLHGLGVEIMAASDNVLRGGLTPKHVNVGELLRVLRFETLPDPVVRPEPIGAGLVTWRTPIREFALVRAEATEAAPVRLPDGGPRIVVCLRGPTRLHCSGAGESEPVTIGPGEAVFVPAPDGPVTVAGQATVFQAAPATWATAQP